MVQTMKLQQSAASTLTILFLTTRKCRPGKVCHVTMHSYVALLYRLEYYTHPPACIIIAQTDLIH